jgi:hypothetical protein
MEVNLVCAYWRKIRARAIIAVELKPTFVVWLLIRL